jgi:penicillin amidase
LRWRNEEEAYLPNKNSVFQDDRLVIYRDEHGVPHVEASTEADLYWGTGYCHAMDRGMQMLLMRILGEGRGSELLEASAEMLAIDKFFRRMNWAGGMQQETAKLTPQAKAFCTAYCQGANDYFTKKIPWEFKLLGYKPEPWKIENIILLARMVGYLTLAQSQAEIERLFIEMVQAGVSRKKLDELFPEILGGLDIELLKKVKLTERIVPLSVKWNSIVPRMMASNNWVISGKKTASGKPILANDPHLETNRLPNVWYEIVLTTKGRYAIGATMPGLPGILIGRNSDVAWGATYTFMDAVDSWIEHCKDGKFLQNENQWMEFRQRKEIIKRKKKSPIEMTFYENDHGVLEGNPFEEGFYLTTHWATSTSGAASINAMVNMWRAANVEDGMQNLGQLESAFNWVLADRHGNIGYQMSGLMPKRRAGVSGFVPLPGWKKENDWQGFVDYKDLPRGLNPDAGFFVTANNDLNPWGAAKPINICMGSYRADRIAHLLAEKERVTVEDCFKIHYDVYSLQAERFMQILQLLLPGTPQGRILREWDCHYNPESQGAFLFEQFYQALRREVFGKTGFGNEIVDFLSAESGIFADFFNNFDCVLLSEKAAWFGGESRDNLYRRVAANALQAKPKPWGEVNQMKMTHLLLGEKMPTVAGFDRGPIMLRGGRATPHQGQIYRSAGRVTSFTPSFRLVTDLSKDEAHTNLAGGPSDRRFSKWYCSDLENWLNEKYKVLKP